MQKKCQHFIIDAVGTEMKMCFFFRVCDIAPFQAFFVLSKLGHCFRKDENFFNDSYQAQKKQLWYH